MDYNYRYGPGARSRGGGTFWLAALVAGGVAAFGLSRLLASTGGRHGSTGALRGEAKQRGNTMVARTVTIDRPREELYAYWRDFSNLPSIMDNVRSVEVIDERRSRWTIAAPGGGEIEFTSTIMEERPGALIAWESDREADVRNSGRVIFREAPGGRGTEVEAAIAYDPPAGAAGRMAAKLFQREPNIQVRRDLKRFKQLMETGEISVSDLAAHA